MEFDEETSHPVEAPEEGGSLGGFHVSDQFNVVLLFRAKVIVLLSTNWQSNYIYLRIDNKSSFPSISIYQAVSV